MGIQLIRACTWWTFHCHLLLSIKKMLNRPGINHRGIIVIFLFSSTDKKTKYMFPCLISIASFSVSYIEGKPVAWHLRRKRVSGHKSPQEDAMWRLRQMVKFNAAKRAISLLFHWFSSVRASPQVLFCNRVTTIAWSRGRYKATSSTRRRPRGIY